MLELLTIRHDKVSANVYYVGIQKQIVKSFVRWYISNHILSTLRCITVTNKYFFDLYIETKAVKSKKVYRTLFNADIFVKNYSLLFFAASDYPEGTWVVFMTCQVRSRAVNYTLFLCIFYVAMIIPETRARHTNHFQYIRIWMYFCSL